MQKDPDIQSLERVRPRFSYAPIIEHAFHNLPELKEISLENNIDFEEILEVRKQLKNEILVNYNSNSRCTEVPKLSTYSFQKFFRHLSSNSLIDIFGHLETGQSQLAMFLAMEFAYTGKRVLYIDGSLSFSTSLILNWSKSKHNKDSSYLSNIHVIQIFDYQSLMDFFERFQNSTSNHDCVLIIDELTTIALANNLYDSEDEWKSREKVEAMFDNIYYTLSDIAYRFNVLTFVTRIQSEKIIKKIRVDLSEYEQIDGTIKINSFKDDHWQVIFSNIFEEVSLELTIN